MAVERKLEFDFFITIFVCNVSVYVITALLEYEEPFFIKKKKKKGKKMVLIQPE